MGAGFTDDVSAPPANSGACRLQNRGSSPHGDDQSQWRSVPRGSRAATSGDAPDSPSPRPSATPPARSQAASSASSPAAWPAPHLPSPELAPPAAALSPDGQPAWGAAAQSAPRHSAGFAPQTYDITSSVNSSKSATPLSAPPEPRCRSW